MIIIVNLQTSDSSEGESGSFEDSQISSGDAGEASQLDLWKYLDLSALGNGPEDNSSEEEQIPLKQSEQDMNLLFDMKFNVS